MRDYVVLMRICGVVVFKNTLVPRLVPRLASRLDPGILPFVPTSSIVGGGVQFPSVFFRTLNVHYADVA